MEPVTHFLTGACLSRAGLNRHAAYATLAMTLAAEAPDLDVLWSLGGPIAGFQHHRGWTHTIAGMPVMAALIVAVVWFVHRSRLSWSARGTEAEPRRVSLAAPVRWGMLYALCLVALGSHLLLDWTNNYGVRPFFPFNPRWYAGSFVFIVEPVMLLALAAGLLAPSLFGLVSSEVGARRRQFRGQGWAAAALLAVAALWAVRYAERNKAVSIAQSEGAGNPGEAAVSGSTVLRVMANPYPLTPFRWHTVLETPTLYRMREVDTLHGTSESSDTADLFFKPAETAATLAAKRSRLGRAYLDWSMWPLVTEEGRDEDGTLTVSFRDLRFLYDTPFLRGRRNAPLSGSVEVDPAGRVVEMSLGSRPKH